MFFTWAHPMPWWAMNEHYYYYYYYYLLLLLLFNMLTPGESLPFQTRKIPHPTPGGGGLTLIGA